MTRGEGGGTLIEVEVRMLPFAVTAPVPGARLPAVSQARVAVPQGSALRQVLELVLGVEGRGAAVPNGCVVLLNGVAVPREKWTTQPVVGGDVVSVLPALVGG